MDLAAMPAGDTVDLILDVDAFRPQDGAAPPQNAFFYLNGLRLGAASIARRATLIFTVPASAFRARDNVVAVDTPDATAPAQFGLADTRMLGIKLFSLQVRHAA